MKKQSNHWKLIASGGNAQQPVQPQRNHFKCTEKKENSQQPVQPPRNHLKSTETKENAQQPLKCTGVDENVVQVGQMHRKYSKFTTNSLQVVNMHIRQLKKTVKLHFDQCKWTLTSATWLQKVKLHYKQ